MVKKKTANNDLDDEYEDDEYEDDVNEDKILIESLKRQLGEKNQRLVEVSSQLKTTKQQLSELRLIKNTYSTILLINLLKK